MMERMRNGKIGNVIKILHLIGRARLVGHLAKPLACAASKNTISLERYIGTYFNKSKAVQPNAIRNITSPDFK